MPCRAHEGLRIQPRLAEVSRCVLGGSTLVLGEDAYAYAPQFAPWLSSRQVIDLRKRQICMRAARSILLALLGTSCTAHAPHSPSEPREFRVRGRESGVLGAGRRRSAASGLRSLLAVGTQVDGQATQLATNAARVTAACFATAARRTQRAAGRLAAMRRAGRAQTAAASWPLTPAFVCACLCCACLLSAHACPCASCSARVPIYAQRVHMDMRVWLHVCLCHVVTCVAPSGYSRKSEMVCM